MASVKNGHAPKSNIGAMPFCDQIGEILVGPGVKNEIKLVDTGLSRLTNRQKDDLDRAKRYAMDQSIQFVLRKKQIAHQQNQQKASQMTQALSLMARLYVGSVSFEIREENLRSMFSVFGPIKSLNMSYDNATGNHKGFAFLEYEVPEAALLAKEAMNGKLIGGRNLKVGRPSNMPAAQPIIEMITVEAKQYHRIYVASVHPDLSEIDIRNVFEAFGEITKVQLARQLHGRGHRGFGYLEFASEQAVKEAIDGMNNFDLGGQYLQVGRCITPPEALMYITPSQQSVLPTAAAVAAATITAKIQAKEVLGKKDEPKRITLPPPKTVVPEKFKKRESERLALPPPELVVPKKIKMEPPSTSIVQPPPPALVVPQLKIEPERVAAIPPPKLITTKPTIKSEFEVLGSAIPPPPPPEPEKPKKPLPEKRDLISRIKLKARPDPMRKAEFGPILKKAELRDKIFDEEFSSNNEQLAITGPTSSMALALRENTQVAKATKEPKKSTKEKSKSLSLAATGLKRKKKFKLSKVRKPKLNSAGALAAVFAAGAINDQMRTEKAKDEATLASQEHVEIRGNDARHMLMHKLMRTNRSTVIVLKNMVDLDGVDEELEDEIREECTKCGTVTDVVIVKEKSLEEVRIFVRFADPTQAENAVQVFDGRYFDGRTVKAVIYDQILFDHDDFTG